VVVILVFRIKEYPIPYSYTTDFFGAYGIYPGLSVKENPSGKPALRDTIQTSIFSTGPADRLRASASIPGNDEYLDFDIED
jgi:hypothetical protein